MTILDKIVEQKKREVEKLPFHPLAAGDLRDAMLERSESRDFLAALKSPTCLPRYAIATARSAPAIRCSRVTSASRLRKT